MACYIWRLNGKVVAYKQTDDYCPPPAIKVSEKDFREMGFYHDSLAAGGSSDAPSVSPSMAAFMDGINAV